MIILSRIILLIQVAFLIAFSIVKTSKVFFALWSGDVEIMQSVLVNGVLPRKIRATCTTLLKCSVTMISSFLLGLSAP